MYFTDRGYIWQPFSTGTGNGWVPRRDKPLPEQMMNQVNDMQSLPGVFHYTRRAHQMSFPDAVISPMVRPKWQISSIFVQKLDDASASLMRSRQLISDTNFRMRYVVGFRENEISRKLIWEAWQV